MVTELATVLLMSATCGAISAQGASSLPDTQSAPPEVRAGDNSGVRAPQKTKNVDPKFPPNALQAGLAGRVVLECRIGVDGKVNGCNAVSGYRSLAAAAIDAVRKWEFTPTTLNGTPVAVVMCVTTRFSYSGTLTLKGLVNSTTDPDPDIRQAAVRRLGTYRPIADAQRQAVQQLLQDPEVAVRATAANALANLEVLPDAQQDLSREFQNDIEALLGPTIFGELRNKNAAEISSRIVDELKGSHAELSDRAFRVASEVFESDFAGAVSSPISLNAELVPILAKYFTWQDVRSLLAFYRSDVGQKMMRVMAPLTQEAGEASRRWMESYRSDIQRALLARFQAEGLIK